MKQDLKKKSQNRKALNHSIFCILSFLFLSVINCFQYGVSYKNSLIISLGILPVHVIYFYTIGYFIIPKCLEKKQYAKMLALTAVICLLVTILYRFNELFVIAPYFSNLALAKDIDTTIFSRKLSNLNQLINAFEKSNLIVWLALAIKFFNMWYERTQLALQAELSFLKAQIHPHFLFNTLNNLYALTLKQSAKSPSIVIGLSEILRYMLHECHTENVKLNRDIEILKSYILLEQIRYGDRLALNLNIIGDLENYYIPPLLMLPLVENAFKHGTSETLKDAWISIDINVSTNRLKFKVANSKPAINDETAAVHFEKIGLQNVRKRLDHLYKNAYQLDAYHEKDFFVANLEIDMNTKCTRSHNKQQSLKEVQKTDWATT